MRKDAADALEMGRIERRLGLHVLEHVAIELQNVAGVKVTFRRVSMPSVV